MTLYEDGNWQLKKLSPYNESVIDHSCPKGGVMYCTLKEVLHNIPCDDCKEHIPDSILTLWTLHNFDNIPAWTQILGVIYE